MMSTWLRWASICSPRPTIIPVLRYWTPEEFEELAKLGYELGFTHMASGPLVRSSYHADLMAEESGPGRLASCDYRCVYLVVGFGSSKLLTLASMTSASA